MSANNDNKKSKLLPGDLEDLDRDLPYGPAGIALFFSHSDRRVSQNEEGKSKEPTFFNINSFDYFYSITEDEDLLDCFLNLPNMETSKKIH